VVVSKLSERQQHNSPRPHESSNGHADDEKSSASISLEPGAVHDRCLDDVKHGLANAKVAVSEGLRGWVGQVVGVGPILLKKEVV
jgi:hypothetical protein